MNLDDRWHSIVTWRCVYVCGVWKDYLLDCMIMIPLAVRGLRLILKTRQLG